VHKKRVDRRTVQRRLVVYSSNWSRTHASEPSNWLEVESL
jgi:hypothetical protein